VVIDGHLIEETMNEFERIDRNSEVRNCRRSVCCFEFCGSCNEARAAAGGEGGRMASRKLCTTVILLVLIFVAALPAAAQSFRVQCPTSTITHPAATNSEPAYVGPTYTGTNGYGGPVAHVNGAIKCQQISGGDGFATMGDGTQTYMFSFGPLSGLADIANGLPGTEFPGGPNGFNTVYSGTLKPGDPATTDDPSGLGPPIDLSAPAFTYNGAVGLVGDQNVLQEISGGATAIATVTGGIVTDVTVTNGGSGYIGPPSVTFSAPPSPGIAALGTAHVSNGAVIAVDVTFTGTGYVTAPTVTIGPASNACLGANPPAPCLTGHVDPRPIEDVGVMNGNIPAPLMAIDEDDEFFLTLTNVGMIMRPDLFEQHTVHFHGYPNASSFYDGVPDASVAINIGGSFTYYYMAPDAGTYFWHCHITPPEHLQMGMVGQLYVRPRQNRVSVATTLYSALQQQQLDLRTACNSAADILCSNPLPAVNTGVTGGGLYAYNDGDGSTRYDVEYPLQIHGFDPTFHFVGMTFNPEEFVDMKDKYFLLNGRSYPDTVTPGPLQTESSDGKNHFSQPLPSIINIPAGGKALLRISDLDVTEYQTLASLGIRMHVIGINAKLLRDQAGNNLDYYTNSITLAGGESLDVILDSAGVPPGTYYLYTSNLDHLSNDAENFGGLMTEVHVN
jgi:FtsP/CotA-like multicopper oxidase with cupredoxin domain